MIKEQSKVLIILFICAMWLTALAQPVQASQASSGEIPVSIDFGDSYSKAESHIELKAENPDNPMPEGSKDGVYVLNITGKGENILPQINYSSTGTYTYTISQTMKNDNKYDYDTKVYLLKVEVTRSQRTGGLQAVTTLHVLGEATKVAGAGFYNASRRGSDNDPTDPIQDPGIKTAVIIEAPRTSDDTLIWPYIGLLIASSGLLIYIVVDIKKRQNY